MKIYSIKVKDLDAFSPEYQYSKFIVLGETINDMTGIIIKIPFDGSGSSSEIRAFSNQTEKHLGIYLGTYSTKEKATKVLDMIQYRYEQYYRKYGEVFNMPADKDVEEATYE